MSCVNYLSCKPLIVLHHDYTTVRGINLQDVPCPSPTHAIVLALFSLGELKGSTLASIVQFAQQHCPEFTQQDIESALEQGIRVGLFRTLRPSIINYLEPLPPIRYTFSERMDEQNQNQEYVTFLVGLVGGFNGPNYKFYFKPFVGYKPVGFRLFDWELPDF